MNYLYARARLHDGSLALVGWSSLPGIPSRQEIAATASELVALCGSGPMMAALVEEYMDDRLVRRFNASEFKRDIKKGA